ncbi:Major facilitator superfamily domain general substrate transporter [Penicillium cf. griseofulvum]|uniref:Major facilitator superfamily domain general substrate transporter n=1 Tax=Penicillium cf. griseofulvum TaxID=2972120 RepID=A0A9W9T262_9EURO|nr:Major facilitator superfamily domain general substrate transporter [Penicillium cf. griseofulvum]KAJ5440291.1 Major facilitator superfamily domain general substrate transporter [Penicillium cf. griseofulvum]KAJ5448339.1 Major facilitator superfamily domain general substrate transporter [Penicillium cf. griseofulvum]
MLEETSPLLGGQKSRWLSVYWLSAVVFCLSVAGTFLNVPLTRLIEDNLCTRYSQGTPTEELCKTDKIQSKLAYLNGGLPLMEAVVGLIVAFPFGVLADRVGRKPIIVLSMIGTSLSLAWELAVIGLPRIISVRFILAGPLFTVIGGGNTVLLANLYSIASDLVIQSDRASAFFLMAFASLLGASVGPAISSAFMETFSPWVPAFISFFVNLAALIPLFFVPETLSPSKRDSNSEQIHPESEERPHSFRWYLSQSLHLSSSIASMKSPSIILVLATFLTAAPEVLGTSQFLAQYISKRFDWPLAKTGYILTLRGVIHMGVLLFTLPLLSKILLRSQRPPVKDLMLARASVAIAAIGALFMAASQIGLVVAGLAVHSLGSGLAPLCRSLATSYVAPQDTSKLNTVIGIVETTGSLFAGPALAWLFEMGMKLGGRSLGLPYYGLAASFVLCLVGLIFVHPPTREEETDES